MKKFTILLVAFTMLACMTPAVMVSPATPTSVSMETLTNTSTPERHYCFGIVKVDRLNLRSEPDYNSPADGAGLVKWDVVTIIRLGDEWHYVETADGRYGYARAEYVKVCE